MNSLDANDVRWTLRLLPKNLRELLKKTGAIVAGGCVRSAVSGERLSDVDLFVPNAALAESVAKDIAKLSDGAYASKTRNAWTVILRRPTLVVQVIHRWTYSEPRALLDSFDFTISCAAIWWNGTAWDSECDPRFYVDLAAKRLVYRSPLRNEDAGGSMLRVLKFYQRGYRIPLDSLGAVIARLMEGINPDALAGVAGATMEQKHARVLTALLVEVDPNLDVGAIAHLPAQDEPIEEVAGVA